jgi:hypothetical protein|nr:MAG TPA: hypothetical protein [Bacteriophage sp.]
MVIYLGNSPSVPLEFSNVSSSSFSSTSLTGFVGTNSDVFAL